MRRLLGTTLRTLASFVAFAQDKASNWADRLDPPHRSPLEKMVADWYQADGERKLRYDYDLGPGSIVFDLGAYAGDWTSRIAARYAAHIFAFEPMPRQFALLQAELGKNPNVRLLNYGLAPTSRQIVIYEGGVGSSSFHGTGEGVEVALRSFKDFLTDEHIETIDLLKINIEGGEYELLEHLIAEGLIQSVVHLQVQFHDFVPNAAKRRELIRERLLLTHRETYCFEFVWEGWRRMENSGSGHSPTPSGT